MKVQLTLALVASLGVAAPASATLPAFSPRADVVEYHADGGWLVVLGDNLHKVRAALFGDAVVDIVEQYPESLVGVVPSDLGPGTYRLTLYRNVAMHDTLGVTVGGAGLQGEPGPVGPQGPQGEVGPMGPMGPQGEVGPTGPMGPQGEVGPMGPMGPQGEVGPVGPAGAQGPQGEVGPVGPAGAQGPQGEMGPVGPAGAKGLQGPQGEVGSIGPAGAQGPQGEVGPMGPAGAQGPQGEVGPMGPAGAQGPQGEVGPVGPAGAQGLQGPQGEVGPMGPAGAQGPQGEVGPMGPMGPAGEQGPHGEVGPMGPAGAQGPQGEVGPAGVCDGELLMALQERDVQLQEQNDVLRQALGDLWCEARCPDDAFGECRSAVCDYDVFACVPGAASADDAPCTGGVCVSGECAAFCGELGVVCPNGFSCASHGYCLNDTSDEVYVPAGRFFMGCNPWTYPGTCPSFAPQHEVTLTTPYAVDRHEVTVAEYAAWQSCLVGGSCVPDPATPDAQKPFTQATWLDAEAYCAWEGKAAGVQQLCTEAQWERAAVGGCELVEGDCRRNTPIFPWGGNVYDPDLVSLAGYDDGYPDVCAHSPDGDSPYGLCDMSGSAAEWVADWWSALSDAPVIDPVGPATGTDHVLRTHVVPSYRQHTSNPHYDTGFRCCRSIP